MLNRKMKVFRDNVHGYIKVPEDYVNYFIDTDIFQRLRNIEQTGMRVLYPSARHDRFIHSLGTYYLGSKAFACLRANLKSDEKNGGSDIYHLYGVNNAKKEENEKFWDRYQILFEIACLLHDCGHAPFSHTMEFLYDENNEGELSVSDKLAQCHSPNFKNGFNEKESAPHERMSALIASVNYKDTIISVLKKYKLGKNNNKKFVEFVARAIIGYKYSNPNTTELKIANCLIELLNSKTIDVDSLDYIIRDSYSSGVNNISIDIDRLLGSLTVIPITSFSNAVYNDKLSANVSYLQISSQTGKCSFIGKCSGTLYANKFNCNLLGYIDVTGNMIVENSPDILLKSKLGDTVKINGAECNQIQNTVKSNSIIEIKGLISSESLVLKGDNITLGKNNDSTINIEAESFDIETAYINGKINGVISGEIVGLNKHIENSNITYSLGYNKNSLSVIENVLDARNYEYQWIYSHHKVVYYSNFLLVELLKRCSNFLYTNIVEKTGNEDFEKIFKNLFSWNRMVKNEHILNENNLINDLLLLPPRPTDCDIVNLFFRCRFYSIDKDDKLKYLLDEFFRRKYKVSLWKSFAEYNLFFSDFSSLKKEAVFRLIQDNSQNSNSKYGFLNEKWAESFRKFGLDNVVWVEASSKIKIFDADKIYIAFNDRILTFRTATAAPERHMPGQNNFFYIYYTPIKNKKFNPSGLCSFLKKELEIAKDEID